ncbi:Predicted amidohydrolase [Halomonas citrativorans]|uniref:Omega-amidase YafV n=1 Tax=Halomonas citrativorans TaxID=2742612 RepID=A0A1R4I4V4_9GAMM|nr:amidohydrolase [Halomonas citrativorans]MBE0403122.1 amidohydrolase [Halomonas citrativorans]SJN14887.1 Predicted amidohydrolase [Halomonas citrativorans]
MSQLKTSLVQCDLRWEDPQANHDHLGRLLGDLDSRDTDLIVLPEMFATGFTMNSREMAQPMAQSQSVAWLQAQAKARNCVITGSVAIVDDGQYYNRMIWATPEGDIRHYDKRHLFRMAGEHERYGMGSQREIVELKGFKLLLSVCYDLRFPVWMRQQPAAQEHFEYDALLCVANWPAPRRQPWRTLLQARAVENLAYVVGVNRVGEDAKGLAYSGDSMLVDFKGEPLIDHPENTPFIETGTLDKTELNAFREKFPAWQDADHFSLLPGVGQ